MGNSDPKDKYQKPPYPQQSQEFPGKEYKMSPSPDYGEQTYKGSEKLKGKTALITGGDSGIGRAVALAYSREGANVMISYLEEDADALDILETIKEEGGNVAAIPGDIALDEHCSLLVHRTVNEFGGIDVLVNNAAYQKTFGSITKISNDDFDKMFRTNVYAPFYLCREAFTRMQEGASIINTVSIQAYKPSPTLLPYASTKGALVTLTKAFAQEAIEKGVRVNAIAPGPVWTPFIPASSTHQNVKRFGEGSLLKRPAQPAELAHLFVYLASDESSYVVGEVYGVTGNIYKP